MNGIDKLHSINETKALIGAKHTKFYGLVAAGKITIVKNGGRSFVRESEIKRYIDSLAVNITPTLRANIAASKVAPAAA